MPTAVLRFNVLALVATVLVAFVAAACSGGDGMHDELAGSSYCGGRCDLALDTIARLGHTQDSISPALGARTVRMSNGTFLLAPTDHPGVLAIYSADGRLLRTFGRAGRGPDEYDTEMLQLYRSGDISMIVDASNQRLTVVDTLGNAIRSHPVPGSVHTLLPLRTRLIAQADIRTADRKRFLLHELDWGGNIVASHVELITSRNEAGGYRPVAAAGDGGIWLAARTEYRLEHYDSLFTFTHAITPRPSWFRTPSAEVDLRVERPEPLIGAISQQSDGLLWVLIVVADADWKPQPRPTREQAIDAAWLQRMIEARDWILDVIDRDTGDRIATKRFDAPIGFGAGDDLLYATSVGNNGQIVVTAMRVTVKSRAN